MTVGRLILVFGVSGVMYMRFRIPWSAMSANAGLDAMRVTGNCWRDSPECLYHGRSRPLVADAPTTSQAAPDMFSREPVVINRERPGRIIVEFGGLRFVKGFATGDGNNCLIHALAQSINDIGDRCVVNVPWIRKELLRRFASGPDQVTEANFLDFRPHGASVIDLIGMSARAEGLDPQGRIRADRFSVTCVAEDLGRVGDVVGEEPGRTSLYILNEGLLHFVPLIRDRSGMRRS